MPALQDLLHKSIPELSAMFVERRRPVPKGLLEALDVDPRQGAHQLAKRIRERYRSNRSEGQRLHSLLRFEIELWADGFGVGGIVLLPLDVRLHIRGRHQAHRMA